ncbi:MAG: cytochrome c [Nitrospinae bacterium]|nr:cytochrome c [Nitrospinota bacterium]
MLKYTSLCLSMFLALSAMSEAQDAGRGEEMFDKKCQGCHRRTDAVKNGPGLAGVTKRRTAEWLHKWLADPKALIESGDPQAVAMLGRFKIKMPTIDLMQDEKNRNDMIAFLSTLE